MVQQPGRSAAAGIFAEFRFVNNLWDKPHERDVHAKRGDPRFADSDAHTPEGYKIQAASAARDQGMLLYENPLDFWNGPRPHLSKEKYDIGAHEYGATGTARAASAACASGVVP